MQVAWLNREGRAWTYGDARPHLDLRTLHELSTYWPDL